MRKYQNFALLLCGILFYISSLAQQQPLNQINILSFSVKNKLPGDVSGWGSIPAGLMLTAQRVPQSATQGIKLVLQIKQGGAKICGNMIDASPVLDFTAVRTFTGTELNGYITNCTILKPGSYSICAQFFNIDRYPISKEICKEFVVEDAVQAQQNYSPPQNIFPVNNKVFKPEEIKSAVTFRWTPLVPKPRDPITYRLKVWQLMQGQNGTQAIRSNPPIITKDVDNITQAVVANFYTGPCKPPYMCDFVWNVEAIDGKGKVLGSSEPTAFKIIVDESNPGACLKLDTLKYSISCIGQDANGKFRYKVQNLFLNKVVGNLDPFMESGTTVNNSNYITSVLPVGTLIQNIMPVSFTGITASVSPSISFEFVSATPLTLFTANLSAYTYHLSAAGSKIYCQKNFEMTFDVPPCKCTTCENIQFTLGQESSQFTHWPVPGQYFPIGYDKNNILYLTQPLVVGPGSIKVVQVKTEVVDFYWYTEGDCKRCNNNNYYWGNLIAGNTNSTGFNTGGTSGTDADGIPLPNSHEIDFASNDEAGAVFNGNIQLQMSLPPQTFLSCCTDCFRFCIRYTIVFKENGVCKTCTKVKCYEVKRQHKKIFNPRDLGLELNDCGEPTIIQSNSEILTPVKQQ